MPTYRTNGAWGAGIGVNLTPAQVDENFYELRTDLDDLIANPPTADSVVSVSQSGFDLTFHTTLGNSLGPLTMPVVQFRWRGEWAPLTLYDAADMFLVTDEGIFTVLADHTSAATFDPLATGGSPATALYNQIIGVGTNSSLDDLVDVIAPSPVAGQVLRYIGGSPDALWQPDTLTLDDLGDVDATAPTLGQVLTWTGSPASWQPADVAATLDELTDVSVPAPNDGDVLTFQAGSPTGWISSAPAAIPTTLDDLTDVTVPTPADGDFLQYDTGSPAGWKNQAGTSISSLGAATLPLNTASLLEISEASGSPVAYASKQLSIANLFASPTLSGTIAGTYNIGGTPSLTVALALPGSGQISSAGMIGVGGTPAAQLHLVGNVSAAAWTQTGINFRTSSATFTDTSSSGAVAYNSINNISNGTLAASSPTTYAVASTLRLGGAPIAGSNVTITAPLSLDVVAGASRFVGNVSIGAAAPATPGATMDITVSAVGTYPANTVLGLSRNGLCLINVLGGSTSLVGFDFGDSGGATQGRVRYDNNTDSLGFGTNGVSDRLLIYSGGDVRIGIGSALATTATDGFLLITCSAGAPTGVPTNAGAGQIPLHFDKTNFQLYAYISGTGWKKSAVWT